VPQAAAELADKQAWNFGCSGTASIGVAGASERYLMAPNVPCTGCTGPLRGRSGRAGSAPGQRQDLISGLRRQLDAHYFRWCRWFVAQAVDVIIN
jgi:hypothetical protein